MSPLINPGLVTGTFDLPGYRIVRVFGIVRGIVVRSRSVLGNFAAGIQTIVGGNITIFSDLCEKTREEAYELMLQHAVVAMRYDATEIMQGVTEVLAYGTTVLVEKIS